MRKGLAASLMALALSACATAGPDYHPPEHSAATAPGAQGNFQSAQGAGFSNADLPDHWWKLYNDPRLDALIAEALTANTDLRVADANLTAAQAVLREVQQFSRSVFVAWDGATKKEDYMVMQQV